MAKSNETTSLSELVGGLVSDVTGLIRKEIELAKAETSEKLGQALGGVEFLIAGAILAIAALGVLLTALVTGIAAFLINRGMSEANGEALSAVIVGIFVMIIAWLLLSRGLSALKSTNLSLERTTASLKTDVKVVKEKI